MDRTELSHHGPRPVGAPHLGLRALEARMLFELGAFAAASPLLRAVGRGDRHPVLVLPGFTADDASTRPLRAVLRSQGYWTHGWRLGQNLGPSARVLAGMRDRLLSLHERHGRPVSLVGWSLGGIYARELAREHPDAVRLVITLGSPFRIRPEDRSAVSPLVDRLPKNFRTGILRYGLHEHEKPPVPVPTSAVYTRTDGVVRWHLCIDVVDDRHENIEVRASHSGLGWHPAAVYAVSDRLAQPEDDWRPFSAPFALRRFYPRPVSWEPRPAPVGSSRPRAS